MGRERIRAWKLVYLCIAGLMTLSLLNCAALKEKERTPEDEAYEHLLRARELLAHGDYEESLKENQRALTISGRNHPGDEAVFNMGLIYAHYKNPGKDFKKSLAFFRRLLKDYPRSHLIEQARIWIGVLQVIEKSKQVDIEIEEMKKEMLR